MSFSKEAGCTANAHRRQGSKGDMLLQFYGGHEKRVLQRNRSSPGRDDTMRLGSLLGSPGWRVSMYPEIMVIPMREELTRAGVKETRTAAEVDAAVHTKGTTLVVVNSICGCAAGKMRPGLRMAMQHTTKPDQAITVFAGQDREATDRARGYFGGHPPTSPSIAILRDGQLVYLMQRSAIETSTAPAIAQELQRAFEAYCAKATA